ncbi:MAG: prepilin-type N-terminal cleavage/methylation domain-containing protein [Gemmatimonadota bacterium]|nr:prepilin-type N-terminal cleavage/methylation domain-containing protein [Gemmatimonadota bacterium]
MRGMRNHWRAMRRSEEGFGLVEALIAVTILVIGLLAVSGLTLASASQARIADWRSDQTAAGLMAVEQVRAAGFAAAASGTLTIDVEGRSVPVTITVTDLSPRLKQVEVVVSGVGTFPARTYRTQLYRPRSLPLPVPSP